MTTKTKAIEPTSFEILDMSNNISICNSSFENFHKICRFCLSFDDVEPFFDITYEQASIQSIILDCLSLKIDLDDSLPYNLCVTCITELIRYYRFKTRCKQVTCILRDAYNNRNSRKGNEPSQSDGSECIDRNTDNLIIKEEEIEHTSTICNDNFFEYVDTDNFPIGNEGIGDTLATYANNANTIIKIEDFDIGISEDTSFDDVTIREGHIKDDASVFNDNITCVNDSDNLIIKTEEIRILPTVCNDNIPNYNETDNTTIDSNRNFVDPMEDCNPPQGQIVGSMTSQLTSYDSKISQKCKVRVCTCRVCKKRFRVSETTKSFNQKSYICRLCAHKLMEEHGYARKWAIDSKPQLESSINDLTTNEPHICNICKQCFKWKSHLGIHMSSHTGIRSHKCCICGQIFMYKSHLDKHILSHTGEKHHKCNICDKSFIHNSYLNDHMLTHKASSRHQCNVCDKSFFRKGYLNRHMLIHTGEKRHKCKVCKNTFLRKSDLSVHELIHDDKKGHKCSVCQKTFSRIHYLNLHMAFHRAETPYKCDVCQKSFIQKCNLNQHMLIHTGEKAYECNICKKCFYRKSTFNSHMLIHKGKREHKCTTCKKLFHFKCTLTKHMLIHTKISLQDAD